MKNAIITTKNGDYETIQVSVVDLEDPEFDEHKTFTYPGAPEQLAALEGMRSLFEQDGYRLVHTVRGANYIQRFYTQDDVSNDRRGL